jgi:hypothetical protein
LVTRVVSETDPLVTDGGLGIDLHVTNVATE